MVTNTIVYRVSKSCLMLGAMLTPGIYAGRRQCILRRGLDSSPSWRTSIPLPHDTLRVFSSTKTICFFLDSGIDSDVQSIASNGDGQHLYRASLRSRRRSFGTCQDSRWHGRLRPQCGKFWRNPNSISVVRYLVSQDATHPRAHDILIAAVPKDQLRLGKERLLLLQLLISEGTDTNATARNGDSPLHLAILVTNLDHGTVRHLYQERLCKLSSSQRWLKSLCMKCG